MQIDFIFSILVLIFSVVVHEVSHGYSAYLLGDNTAKYQGRLTLNPIKHLELFGSIILPTVSYLTGGFIIGWAKPVPYNPNNFRPEDRRKGNIWVASAGILANLSIAVFFGIIIRLGGFLGLSQTVIDISSTIVFLNIVLAIFNLMPFPPLDGSKIIFGVLGHKSIKIERFMEKYSIGFLIFFLFFLWRYITPAIYFVFKLMTGI